MNKASFTLSIKSVQRKIYINPDDCLIKGKTFTCDIYEEIDGIPYKFNVVSDSDGRTATIKVYIKDKLIIERYNIPIRYFKTIFLKKLNSFGYYK